jgi:uncharacterized protein YbjQ (UPF0145 family)
VEADDRPVTVGLIVKQSPYPKPLQILGPDDALEPLKAEARAIGANGLILNFAEPVQSGIVSRGIYAEALAIRLTSKTP